MTNWLSFRPVRVESRCRTVAGTEQRTGEETSVRPIGSGRRSPRDVNRDEKFRILVVTPAVAQDRIALMKVANTF